MNAGTKLAGFALVLAAMVGGGAAVGAAVGPIEVDTSGEHDSGHAASSEPGEATSACPTTTDDADGPGPGH